MTLRTFCTYEHHLHIVLWNSIQIACKSAYVLNRRPHCVTTNYRQTVESLLPHVSILKLFYLSWKLLQELALYASFHLAPAFVYSFNILAHFGI